MRLLALFVASAACGRVGFDDVTVDAVAKDTGTVVTRRPCGASLVAPSQITIEGDVFTYLDFNNNRMPVSGVAIAALADDGSTLQTTVSDSAGYHLTIDTHEIAQNIRIRATQTSRFTTTTYLDTVVDHDISVYSSALWSYGELPLWAPGSIGSVYSAAGVELDLAKSTYTVVVEDCGGAPLAGVTITVDPPPELQTYVAVNGNPDFGSKTIAPFSGAVGFNQPAGPARITAAAPGLEFDSVDVVVDAGEFTTLVLLQPLVTDP